MAKTPPRPPTAVVDSIGKQATLVREAAENLTKRIEVFEEFLANLPGRVEAWHSGPHPDDDPQDDPDERMNLTLRLSRNGKNWELSWSTFYPARNVGDGFQRLKDAPLKIKLAAVDMFPDLLVSIEQSQAHLAERLNTASTKFDAFFETVELVLPPALPKGPEQDKILGKIARATAKLENMGGAK